MSDSHAYFEGYSQEKKTNKTGTASFLNTLPKMILLDSMGNIGKKETLG